MLKIKDNVDLKELEKFGFKYVEWNYNHEYGFSPKLYVKDINFDDIGKNKNRKKMINNE